MSGREDADEDAPTVSFRAAARNAEPDGDRKPMSRALVIAAVAGIAVFAVLVGISGSWLVAGVAGFGCCASSLIGLASGFLFGATYAAVTYGR